METELTKSLVENSGNEIRKQIEKLWQWLKRVLSRAISKLAPMYYKKHMAGISRINNDGQTKEKDRISGLTYDEMQEISVQYQKDNVAFVIQPENVVDDKGKKLSKKQTQAHIAHFTKCKAKSDTNYKKNLKHPNNIVYHNRYLYYKNKYDKQLDKFKNTKWTIITNKSKERYNQDRYEEILKKREEKYNVDNSKFKENINNEKERDNSSSYDYARAEIWMKEQKEKGNFYGLTDKDIQDKVTNHFEKFKYDGLVEPNKFSKNYFIHTVTAASAAQIANELDKIDEKYDKIVEYSVTHKYDKEGSELADIYINDEDIEIYSEISGTKSGEYKHCGSIKRENEEKNDSILSGESSLCMIPLYDNQVSAVRNKLKELDYSIKYENIDNKIVPVCYIDTKYVEDLEKIVEDEKSLSNTQAELNAIIHKHQEHNEAKDINISSDEVAKTNVDFNVDIDEKTLDD